MAFTAVCELCGDGYSLGLGESAHRCQGKKAAQEPLGEAIGSPAVSLPVVLCAQCSKPVNGVNTVNKRVYKAVNNGVNTSVNSPVNTRAAYMKVYMAKRRAKACNSPS